MTTNKKFLSALVISVLLSACGSNASNETAEAKTDDVQEQEAPKGSANQQATKLIATPVNAADRLEGHEMKSSKSEYSSWQRGRVQFLNLEGGFYGIILDSGKKILPMNMKKEFAQHGAIVRIKGKVKNVMTIQQWGTPFSITEIELISTGSNVNPSDM